ncbi:MAG: glycosyltransferase family 2 protein, partial [Leptolyngbyaceae cyanobacterium SL_7_1]|nr:glycosyltransferase family 2 protein [Leptolyngbyaceae cyanobacterium SL_7_1]
LWGLLVPAAAIGLAMPTHGLSLFLLLGYPVLIWRIDRARRQRGDTPADARLYAFLCVLSKFPQFLGQLKYWLNRWQGKRATLIEYKLPAATPIEGGIHANNA